MRNILCPQSHKIQLYEEEAVRWTLSGVLFQYVFNEASEYSLKTFLEFLSVNPV
jgi:hypothetical protein